MEALVADVRQLLPGHKILSTSTVARLGEEHPVSLLVQDRLEELDLYLSKNGASAVDWATVALVNLVNRKLEDARRQAREALRLDSSQYYAWLVLGWTELVTGTAGEALLIAQEMLRLKPGDPSAAALRVAAEAQSGDPDAAQALRAWDWAQERVFLRLDAGAV